MSQAPRTSGHNIIFVYLFLHNYLITRHIFAKISNSRQLILSTTTINVGAILHQVTTDTIILTLSLTYFIGQFIPHDTVVKYLEQGEILNLKKYPTTVVLFYWQMLILSLTLGKDLL